MQPIFERSSEIRIISDIPAEIIVNYQLSIINCLNIRLSQYVKEHLSRMQSRACTSYAEARVFFEAKPQRTMRGRGLRGTRCAIPL